MTGSPVNRWARRSNGWERETAKLRPDQGLSVYRPCSPGRPRPTSPGTSRRPVPLDEVLATQEHMAEQLRELPDGGTSRNETGP